MKTRYDLKAPKKALNLSVNSDLLKQAHALNIDLSYTLESALKQKLAEQPQQQWKIENSAAIKAYNDFVEDNGCFSDEYRSV